MSTFALIDGLAGGVDVRWKSPAYPLALDLARGLARDGRETQ